MKSLLLLVTVLSIATAAIAAPMATVTLAPVRGSTAHGMADLTQRGSDLIVRITMSVPQGPKQQANGQPRVSTTAYGAHIHRGSCPNPDKKPLYPLNTVTGGKSTTVLKNVSLEQLAKGHYTISVHKSAHDPTNPIACGDVRLLNPGGTTQ